MTKTQRILDFIRAVEWVTPMNICYLIDGTYSEKMRKKWNNRLDVLTKKHLKILHNRERKRGYAHKNSKREDIPTNIYRHEVELRNCLAILARLHDYSYDLTLDKPSDARFNHDFIEFDTSEEGWKKIRTKLEDYYSGHGDYRVLFIMGHTDKEYLEINRVKKLFEISAEVLKEKPNRVMGACYTEFLKSGKLYRRGEV